MPKPSFIMPPVCFIVARNFGNNVIGCEGRLPWKLKTDMGRFRTLTNKHAVIMGRKTFESIGHPLPNRFNIIVSRSFLGNSQSIDPHGTETKLYSTKSAEDALFCSDIFTIINDTREIFIIGGAEIYKIFKRYVDRVYLTEVFSDISGDATFDEPFSRRYWEEKSREEFSKSEIDEFASRYLIFDKKSSKKRLRSFSEIKKKKEEEHPYMESLNDIDASVIHKYAKANSRWKSIHQHEFHF